MILWFTDWGSHYHINPSRAVYLRSKSRKLPILCVFWEHLSCKPPEHTHLPAQWEVRWEEFLLGGNRNTTLRDSFAWLAMPGKTTHPAEYRHKFESLVCRRRRCWFSCTRRSLVASRKTDQNVQISLCSQGVHRALITSLKIRPRKQYYCRWKNYPRMRKLYCLWALLFYFFNRITFPLDQSWAI